MVNVKSANEVYKCSVCGNVVEVAEVGGGELVCCGKPMNLLEEKTIEQEGEEKHVPVIEIEGNKVKVKVGSVPHPMEKEHWIQFIELIRGGKIIAKAQLSQGNAPEAEFCLDSTENLRARELCNIHGLWTS